MSIVSFEFFVFIGIALILYYLLPRKRGLQMLLLLLMSIVFYWLNAKAQIAWIAASLFLTFVLTRIMAQLPQNSVQKRRRAVCLLLCILSSALPLIGLKYILGSAGVSIVLPMGISFYSLQLIGYSVDIFKGSYKPESNIFRFALFAMFFPHILQGPIARYDQISKTLYAVHKFDETKLMQGFLQILWGLFLKLVIADRAALVVDTIYADPNAYAGCFVLVAGILYSFQLYADFMGCVCIARGVSYLFGVELAENFNHPYFSVSIKDFWRRWHISLSTWLRDYVYIPLGGNRKGRGRKYINLMITFLVSGFWHGVGFQFVFWGALHGFYQIIEDLVTGGRRRAQGKKSAAAFPSEKKSFCFPKQLLTFILVMIAWIFFRAESLQQGLRMIAHMVTDFKPAALFSQVSLELGLDIPGMVVLLISLLVLLLVSFLQERGSITGRIIQFPAAGRYAVYLGSCLVILLFGIYGSGYDAADFIYGGF